MSVHDYDLEDVVRLMHEVAYGEGYLENHRFTSSDSGIWDEVDYVLRKYDNKERRYVPKPVTIRDIEVACSESVGGHEGDGEVRYIVVSISDGTDTRWFRKDGYYASYDGTTWDGVLREVKPVEKTVTFYE